MKASFNGVRKRLTNSFNELIKTFEERPNEQLIDKLDEVRDYIVTLNCMYDPDCKDDMDEIEIDIPFVCDHFANFPEVY